MTVKERVKTALKEKRLVIGSRSVIKGVKLGRIDTVIYASNLPENKKRDLTYYSHAAGFSLQRFDGDSAELGELCGKPFSILMVGIIKNEKT